MNCRQLIYSSLFACALMSGGAMTAHAAEKHSHGGHSHDAHGHGKSHDLGTTTVAGLKFKVVQVGEVKAGGEGAFEIELEKGQKKPAAVRVWTGIESARGSVKSKADADGQVYHAHVEVPKKLPEGSQLWIEVDPGEGKKEKVAFSFKR